MSNPKNDSMESRHWKAALHMTLKKDDCGLSIYEACDGDGRAPYVQVILSKCPFNFGESLSAREAREIGQALLNAADGIEPLLAKWEAQHAVEVAA